MVNRPMLALDINLGIRQGYRPHLQSRLQAWELPYSSIAIRSLNSVRNLGGRGGDGARGGAGGRGRYECCQSVSHQCPRFFREFGW
ncbi:MAG: hypothetical protein OXF73_09630 [Gammaproteobacteria bacterium]|nr:hypothetical protein [Gammaproteobacteria bacterium]